MRSGWRVVEVINGSNWICKNGFVLVCFFLLRVVDMDVRVWE